MTFFAYVLATLNALCTASVMSAILVISAGFYARSLDASSSAVIYVLYYVCMGLVGLFGRRILQIAQTTSLGIYCALIGAGALLALACFPNAGPWFVFLIMVIIFLAHGLDFPNLMRFFIQVMEPKKRIGFFSFKEGSTYLLSLVTPLIAGIVCKKGWSGRFFVGNALVYMLIYLTWVSVKKMTKGYKEADRAILKSWFGDFKFLWDHKSLRTFTFCRMGNTAGYVLTVSLFPLIVGFFCKKTGADFSILQSKGQFVMSFSFLIASLFGMHFNKKSKTLPILIMIAALGGFFAVGSFLVSTYYMPLVYVSLVLWGIGTFSLKVSSSTLGGAITPIEVIGPIVIAGDAVLKIWSSLVSSLGILFFKRCFHLSSPHWGYGILLLMMTLGALITPLFLLKVHYRIRKGETPEQMAEESAPSFFER